MKTKQISGALMAAIMSTSMILAGCAGDDISILNLYLKEGSTFTGAINPDGASGDVYVELKYGSKWTLSADSNIKSLTCDADSIDLNGHTLTVNGKTYASGSKSTGDAIEIRMSEGGDGQMQPPSDGARPERPDGEPPAKPDGEPPVKPEGMGTPPAGDPPAKPD